MTSRGRSFSAPCLLLLPALQVYVDVVVVSDLLESSARLVECNKRLGALSAGEWVVLLGFLQRERFGYVGCDTFEQRGDGLHSGNKAVVSIFGLGRRPNALQGSAKVRGDLRQALERLSQVAGNLFFARVLGKRFFLQRLRLVVSISKDLVGLLEVLLQRHRCRPRSPGAPGKSGRRGRTGRWPQGFRRAHCQAAPRPRSTLRPRLDLLL